MHLFRRPRERNRPNVTLPSFSPRTFGPLKEEAGGKVFRTISPRTTTCRPRARRQKEKKKNVRKALKERKKEEHSRQVQGPVVVSESWNLVLVSGGVVARTGPGVTETGGPLFPDASRGIDPLSSASSQAPTSSRAFSATAPRCGISGGSAQDHRAEPRARDPEARLRVAAGSQRCRNPPVLLACDSGSNRRSAPTTGAGISVNVCFLLFAACTCSSLVVLFL